MKSIYSCPQCRETFTPRPVLRRNNMLVEVVEKLKNTELQAASPVHYYTGPGDVDCDSCTGRKHKAVKSCLVCLASFCEDHLKPHYQSQAFKKHKLVEACVDLQEKICSQHDKLMEIYCRTDQSFICYLCMTDEHKGHDTVSTTAERSKKQSFPSLCVSPGCDDSPSFTVNQHLSFDGVRKSVSDLKKRVEEICQEDFNKIRPQDFCYLTLDPNTAHPQLILSEKNRVVRCSEKKQRYSDHPERFDFWVQLLCKESVCGRCYWEVEWKSGVVFLSVSYKEISRKGEGDECGFGFNTSEPEQLSDNLSAANVDEASISHLEQESSALRIQAEEAQKNPHEVHTAFQDASPQAYAPQPVHERRERTSGLPAPPRAQSVARAHKDLPAEIGRQRTLSGLIRCAWTYQGEAAAEQPHRSGKKVPLKCHRGHLNPPAIALTYSITRTQTPRCADQGRCRSCDTGRRKRSSSSLGARCFCYTTGQARSSSEPACATTSRSSSYNTGCAESAGSLAPIISSSSERETCNAAPPAPAEEAAARHAFAEISEISPTSEEEIRSTTLHTPGKEPPTERTPRGTGARLAARSA
ncbi:finTRIM family, member 54 [Silurus meridionalis]|nr:finTRIM family, member 54 [Silurus meridionalis]